MLSTVKRTWERGWRSPLCIIFFWFWYRGYSTDGPKTALPQPKQKHARSSLKTKHVAWTCSLHIGTQYWTDLHGIALKNNELNVAMTNIRHWGLVLICILYTAWWRGVFADIFAPVHDDDMSTQFLCAWLCTANIFVYVKVRALAKCNLFQSASLSHSISQ